jgi:hypothetical protein
MKSIRFLLMENHNDLVILDSNHRKHSYNRKFIVISHVINAIGSHHLAWT